MLVACGGRSMGANTNTDSGTNTSNDGSADLSCELGTCEGCCDALGVCQSGLSDSQCGSQSQECADCAVLSGTCADGACQETAPCGPHNCAEGCCSAQGDCLSGAFDNACGSAGDQCSDCGTLDCREGSCCLDHDDDGYGDGCPSGDDCDDNAPGIVGQCQVNGCPQGWAYIPAGDFIAGSDPNDSSSNEPYEHVRYLDSFCIQSAAVLVDAYRQCQSMGICDVLQEDSGEDGYCNWSLDGATDRSDYPMNCILWLETRNYCQAWVGGDLPTEWQWEKAARGTDGRPFPWGTESPIDCSRCNYAWCLGEDQNTYTWPSGYLSSSDGDSPYGLKDMCGNIMNFTRSCTTYLEDRDECILDGNEKVVARGWAAAFPPATLDESEWFWFTVYNRGYGTPTSMNPLTAGNDGIGFRCMRLPSNNMGR